MTALFRQKDVERAARAVAASGHPVNRVDISPDGQISVHIGEPAAAQVANEKNDWD